VVYVVIHFSGQILPRPKHLHGHSVGIINGKSKKNGGSGGGVCGVVSITRISVWNYMEHFECIQNIDKDDKFLRRWSKLEMAQFIMR
jgi:hypothetical protein